MYSILNTNTHHEQNTYNTPYSQYTNPRHSLSRKYLGLVFIASAKNSFRTKDIKNIQDELTSGMHQRDYNNKYEVILSYLDINTQWRKNNIESLKKYFKV